MPYPRRLDTMKFAKHFVFDFDLLGVSRTLDRSQPKRLCLGLRAILMVHSYQALSDLDIQTVLRS